METPNGWDIDAVRLDQGHENTRSEKDPSGSKFGIKGGNFIRWPNQVIFETVIEDGRIKVYGQIPSQV